MLDKKYLIVKDKKDKTITYFEYDKIEGYNISPKLKITDAINVNKVVIINPSLVQKVSKKKIEIKFKKLLNLLNIIFETDDDTGTAYYEGLNEISKLRLEIKTKYKKNLEEEFLELTLKKLDILEHELKLRIYYLEQNYQSIEDYSYSDEFEVGRRSR